MFMKSILRTLTVTSTALLIATGSAYAEKPEKGNGNQGKNKEQSEQRGPKENRKGGGNEKGGGDGPGKRAEGRDYGQGGVSVSFNFGSAETRIVRDYYVVRLPKASAHPGLPKKAMVASPQARPSSGRRVAPWAAMFGITTFPMNCVFACPHHL